MAGICHGGVLGIGHLAVEVIAIHQVKHLLEHLPLLLLQLAGILTTSQHQHQVVAFTQHGRATKGLHKGRDVLAADRPGNRQQWRQLRIAQKRT